MIKTLTSPAPVPYEDTIQTMETRVAAIRAGEEPELLWFLEHPSLYTAGTSAKEDDLLNPRFPVHKTGRGGQYTYHGPGQRAVYVMLDLQKRQEKPDLRKYVWQLEEWLIRTLNRFGVKGERRKNRIGIWVVRPDGTEAKIAAIGVRIRRGVSYHGVALNVDPDLSHFDGIVPCGIKAHGVTSLAQCLERAVSMDDIDEALKTSWAEVFGQPAQ